MSSPDHSPLPPEPTSTPAGKIVGNLLWLMMLAGSALVVLGLWGLGDPALLLKSAATLGLLGLVTGISVMALRR